MRKINKIILHCSATKEGQKFTVKDVRFWHTSPTFLGGRGWKDVGYHYVILLDGTVEAGRPESEVGAHTLGQNTNSISICYIGGIDANGQPKDTRTDAQREALIKLVKELKVKYPGATVHGHNEFANKACPSFNVKNELKTFE